MADIKHRFIGRSRAYLTKDYLPTIQMSVDKLSEEDVWWQPNPASNSVGHLVLHLTGNLRQWIVSGLGGTEDNRQRHLEFAPDHRPALRELLDDLSRAVSDADDVLSGLDSSIMDERFLIQGESVTGFDALFHAVEHFSMHTGQIIYIAKLRNARDLAFYEVKNGIARPRWPDNVQGS